MKFHSFLPLFILSILSTTTVLADTLIDKIPINIPYRNYTEEIWIYLKHPINNFISILYEDTHNEITVENTAIEFKAKYYNTIEQIQISLQMEIKTHRWIHIGIVSFIDDEKLHIDFYTNEFKETVDKLISSSSQNIFKVF